MLLPNCHQATFLKGIKQKLSYPSNLTLVQSSILQKGFTLIELILVIILVSILTVMAVPKFSSTSTLNSQFYFDQVLASVRFAQKLAIGSGCHVQLSLSGSSITLQMRNSCIGGGAFTLAVRDPATGAGTYTKTAPIGVTISSANLPFYFDGLGRCYLSSSGAISSNYSITVGTHTLTVLGQTGFVSGN
ncbi:MAG: mshC [Francisellaceae bacterium]|nr:mshC [Francisellaceae bacterium]